VHAGLTVKMPKPKITAPKASQKPLDEVLGSQRGELKYKDQVVNCNKESLDKIKKLGAGSFGQVWLMRHKALDALFAVKQIRDSMNEQERQQLLTDLKIIQESECPYIVLYHGFDVREGDVWIFMESMCVPPPPQCRLVWPSERPRRPHSRPPPSPRVRVRARGPAAPTTATARCRRCPAPSLPSPPLTHTIPHPACVALHSC